MKKKQKPKIIEDKKQRGEWAESVFMERAGAHGLPVSRPWGEMSSYDFVIGKTGRFVSVQVKSTLSRLKTGYVCTVRGGHKAYAAGSFDFLAAYVIPDDTWYIIPAELIEGKKVVTLYPNSAKTKYEKYREAWDLLRNAMGASTAKELQECEQSAFGGCTEDGRTEKEGEPIGLPGNAVGRLQASMNFFRRQMERGGVGPRKVDEE